VSSKTNVVVDFKVFPLHSLVERVPAGKLLTGYCLVPEPGSPSLIGFTRFEQDFGGLARGGRICIANELCGGKKYFTSPVAQMDQVGYHFGEVEVWRVVTQRGGVYDLQINI
jgi:hypothetical protein